MRRGQPDFVGKPIEIRGERKNRLAREVGEKHDPRSSKIERKIVENTVWLVRFAHQLIKPLGGAGNHVRDVPDVEANPLRLPRRA